MSRLYANEKYVLIETYTPADLLNIDVGESLMSEDGEAPLMVCALDREWLARRLTDELDGKSLEEYIDEEGTYETFEYEAADAMEEGHCAFALYQDEQYEEHVWFPETIEGLSIKDAMQAYHEFLRKETIFDHICRKVRNTPYQKDMPVNFTEDGIGQLVFGEHNPDLFDGVHGAEEALVAILRRCGETVEKNSLFGYLRQG